MKFSRREKNYNNKIFQIKKKKKKKIPCKSLEWWTRSFQVRVLRPKISGARGSLNFLKLDETKTLKRKD